MKEKMSFFNYQLKENIADKIVVELTAESFWAQLKEQAKDDEFAQLEQMARVGS